MRIIRIEDAYQPKRYGYGVKEYSVRYFSRKVLVSVCKDGKTVKYTYEEAIKKAKELNTRTDVDYCKIYKGRTLIETIYK